MMDQSRVEDINDRLAARNVPAGPLPSRFDIRAVPTKYAHLPIVDRRTLSTVPMQTMTPYNWRTNFNPGTAHGPWCGFATHVNDESKLRNQYAALQRADQAYFVPASTSDLYVPAQFAPTLPQEQPFPDLFHAPTLAPFNPNEHKIGTDFFANHTRQQLKAYVAS